MNNVESIHGGKSGDNNQPVPPECVNKVGDILKNNGWLCGFRTDNMDAPRASSHRVASYVDSAAPLIRELNNVLIETINTYNKRDSNYVHDGWSLGAIMTVSPWTGSRMDAANQQNPSGTWTSRRTLVQRLRVEVPLEDLAPEQGFEAAIEEALRLPTRFEKFQAVYRALDRWGDVVPLEIELGTSVTVTDTEANFSQLPMIHSTLYNSLSHVLGIRTASVIRKGAAGNKGWNDGTWHTVDVPATEWRIIRVIRAAPTLSLISGDIQTRLADLKGELIAYTPPPTIDLIYTHCKLHDDRKNALKTISQVDVRCGHHIVVLSVTYLDGTTSGDGGNAGTHTHPFMLAEGEHIVEMVTWTDSEWLRAIQFITTEGRCSGIYGWFEGHPTISRSEGGILAGFLTRTKNHAQLGYMVTGVHGIWRHDLFPRAPKESDVYSDYFSGKTQHGEGFNDRALIGNSSSIYISSIEVRANIDIHSIEFTYTDIRNSRVHKFKSPRHGGSHGPCYRFDLERGEHVVSVTGKFGDHWLTQLCFATNLGRVSDVYGGGAGEQFTARAPLGEDGRSLRLQYVIGKCAEGLNGVMFVWTPGLPS